MSTYTLEPLYRSIIRIASSHSAGLSKAVLAARAAQQQGESLAEAAMAEVMHTEALVQCQMMQQQQHHRWRP